MGESTEELSQEIARTRADLTRNVDELTDKVSPSQVVARRKEAARSRFTGMKEKVMGSAHDATSSARSALPGSGAGSGDGSLKESVQAAGHSVGDTAGGAVQQVQAKAEGNPMAAGVIAFGAGMLLSSLFPASQKEQELAQRGLDTAQDKGQPLMDQAKSLAGEMGDQLKETAMQGADEVRSTAQGSAQTLKDEGQTSVQNVRSQ